MMEKFLRDGDAGELSAQQEVVISSRIGFIWRRN